MKRIFGLIILCGCAHTRVKNFYNNQFTVCGNKFAKRADYDKQAEKQCSSLFKVVGGEESTTGNFTYGDGKAFAQTENCLIYQCGL